MKHARTLIPVAATLLLAGCISVIPEQKHSVPRYDVSLPDAPASAATGEKARAPAAVLCLEGKAGSFSLPAFLFKLPAIEQTKFFTVRK